jgi:hypothetical protein
MNEQILERVQERASAFCNTTTAEIEVEGVNPVVCMINDLLLPHHTNAPTHCIVSTVFYICKLITCIKIHTLTRSPLMSYVYIYICGVPCKARSFSVVYMDLRLATLKAVSFYFLHNVSTLNQCRKLSCVTVVYKYCTWLATKFTLITHGI